MDSGFDYKICSRGVKKTTPVVGIKTASPLLKLKCFNIIDGFIPDYMHCFLAGVIQQFTEYLIHSVGSTGIEIMDSFLTKIKVPDQISRLSRPLKERRFWKAREWENWALYYSIPVLDIVLKDKKR